MHMSLEHTKIDPKNPPRLDMSLGGSDLSPIQRLSNPLTLEEGHDTRTTSKGDRFSPGYGLTQDLGIGLGSHFLESETRPPSLGIVPT